MPDEVVRLQEIESVDNGGDLISRNGICRYHTPEGCSLVVLKSPSCFGQICPDLRHDLFERFGEKAQVFVERMRAFGRASMAEEPIQVLQYMIEAIEAGASLARIERAGETEKA